MKNNTRERSNELIRIAANIAKKYNINPATPPMDNYSYIIELMVLGKCHRETARKVWHRYLQYAGRPTTNWGGRRRNAGRKSAIINKEI